MAITSPADVYSPEVVAQLASERVFTNTALMASGYISDARLTAIRDGRAETVSFPYETNTTLNVQVNARAGSAVTPDKFDIDYETANITSKIISISNDDRALAKMQQLFDPNQFMAVRIANRIQTTLQAALIATGITSSLTYTELSGIPSIKSLKRAMIENWGDKASETPPLVVLHSKVAYDLETSEEITKIGVYGSMLRPGEITSIAGINFIMLDAVTDTLDVYANLILRPNALELWLEPGQAYDPIRVEGTTSWVNDWAFDYAVHLSRDVPVGAIVYNCASTLDQ